jgi:hypothetical protein
MTEAPFRKLTVPLNAGLPPARTVAVRVTALPKIGAEVELLRVVVVGAATTVTTKAEETEEARFHIPP